MCEIADIHCFGFDFLADKFEEVLFLFLLVVHEEQQPIYYVDGVVSYGQKEGIYF